jgi:hypothetical protein
MLSFFGVATKGCLRWNRGRSIDWPTGVAEPQPKLPHHVEIDDFATRIEFEGEPMVAAGAAVVVGEVPFSCGDDQSD